MKHNAIDQTELVNNRILFRSDYMVESTVIDESQTDKSVIQVLTNASLRMYWVAVKNTP